MALNTRISVPARTALADALVDLIDVGASPALLRIWSGAQPANPAAAETGTKLAEFTLPNPAFGAAASGVATANAITAVVGLAAGTAGYFRVITRGGLSLMDGEVGTSGADMNLNTLTISVGVDVSVTSWTVTMPGA
jgi:hypothetical protein